MRRAWAALAALLSVVTPAIAQTLPGVGARDPRVTVDGTRPPWSGVARLQTPGVSRCSAIVVAPRIVLTAAHCVWNRRRRLFLQAFSVHVLARYDRGGFASHAIGARLRVSPGYDPLRPEATAAQDVAVVTLATPLDTPPLALATEPLAPPVDTMLGGYNQDRDEVVEADTACRILAGGPLLLHSCSGTHGTSGGPLLVRDAAGAWRVAGLQVGAFVDHAGGVAVPLATLQDALLRAGATP